MTTHFKGQQLSPVMYRLLLQFTSHLLSGNHKGRHPVAVADPHKVELQSGAAQSHAVGGPGPLGVGQHQVGAGVGLDVLVSPDVADNLGALVLEHLATLGMVVVVVGVEEVLDGGLGHLSDLDQHVLCVSLVHWINHHDTL